MNRLERWLARLEDGCAALAMLVLVATTLSVCLEVVSRYGFNRPFIWVVEYTEYGLLYMTFLAAAWNLREGGHIRIELVHERLSARAQAVCDVSGSFLGLAVSLVLTIFGFLATQSAFERGLHRTSLLETPTWIVMAIIPVGGLLLAARYLHVFAGHAVRLRTLLRGKP